MPTPIADLPTQVVSMLRDDATLLMAKNVLEESLRDNQAHIADIESRRPRLGFLASKKDRDEYTNALDKAAKHQAAIAALLGRVNFARERSHPSLRAALVQHLGQKDPLYSRGLKASRFHEHWHRSHAIVVDRMRAFIRDLRETCKAMNDDTAQARSRHSGNTNWRLGATRSSAVELERAVDELNQTATDYSATVAGTPFATARLPSLEHWNCIKRIDTISGHQPNVAAPDADQFLREFVEIKQPSLETLEGMFKAATIDHTQLAETKLRSRWSELLAYAEKHLVADAEIEPAIADIEKRQAEFERARLNAQLENRPFLHETP